MSLSTPPPLRILRLRTPDTATELPVELEPYVAKDPLCAQAAREGGVGLATALLAEPSGDADGPAPVALAVGSALVRALPTAARLSLVTRGVLLEGCVDGQVGGGDLARRLAALCDGLLLTAPAQPGADGSLCLHLSGTKAEFVRIPELDEASPREALRHLGKRFGEGSALVLGPARTAGFSYSGLTAGEIGGGDSSPTSFLGRGGVGARFSELGLRALFLTGPCEGVRKLDSGMESRESAEEFARLLRRSPRLAARAEGGTLELLDLHARSAEIEGPSADGESWAQGMAAGAQESRSGRHGCKGCPTPCGLVFDRSAEDSPGRSRGVRFGALHAVTARLGLDRFGDGLELLERCDDLGLDAKETGLSLFAVQLATERGILSTASPRGDVRALLAILEDVVGSGCSYSPEFAQGADALARRFGLIDEVIEARRDLLGSLVKNEVASVLARGADSGRFAGAAEDQEALQRFPAAAWEGERGLAIQDEEGRAALALCLQEDWIAATDALGICSFSCRALLEDGLVDTSALARLLLRSSGEMPGEEWLSLGAAVCELQGRMKNRSGATDGTRFEEVYRALRAERQATEPQEVLRERLSRVRTVESPAPVSSAGDGIERSPGTVILRSFGALAEAMGAERYPLELDLPATVAQVLQEAATAKPSAERLLFAPSGALLPATHRDGARLFGDTLVMKDEILDLVLALRGG